MGLKEPFVPKEGYLPLFKKGIFPDINLHGDRVGSVFIYRYLESKN